MTAFIAEAQRLGIDIPQYIPSFNRVSSNQYDDEGLCVSDCLICRNFRNTVRAALELERQQQTWFFEDPAPVVQSDVLTILGQDYPDEAVAILLGILPEEKRLGLLLNLQQVVIMAVGVETGCISA